MIDLIADQKIKGVLEELIQQNGIDDHGKDVTVVILGTMNDTGRSLDDVLRRAESGDPIVMSSINPDLPDLPKWQAAMGYPNVTFVDMLHIMEELQRTIDESIRADRPKDELAIELANTVMPKDEIRALKHDLGYVKNGSKDQAEWRKRAERLFGELSYEEMLEKVENATEQDGFSLFKDREINGTFCDVQGTILLKDGAVNEGLLFELQVQAETSPVRIWTDGNIDEIRHTLRQLGITWQILPKSLFEGAKVEEVYDDLPEAEFREKYGIEVEKYHQITPPAEDLREEKPDVPELPGVPRV